MIPMKNYLFVKVAAAITVFLNLNGAYAQARVRTLTDEDIKNLQNLIEKKVLNKVNGDLQLNNSLKNAGLIEYLENSKITNCIGGGSCT